MLQSLLHNSRETAFKQLFETYYAPFCLYARRYIADKDTCEDIVSEVFVNLWSKEEDFNPQSSTALGYIKMCVKNSCLNYLKHQEHEWVYEEFVKQKAPVYETEADSVYTLDEMYKMLQMTLQQLPDHYRKVFIESCFHGKTQAEIAEELNVSVKTVNRYKQKVLDMLRQELKDYLPLLYYISLLEMFHPSPFID